MTKLDKLGDGKCQCLTIYEKGVLLNALSSARIDAERILSDVSSGRVRIGKPPEESKKELGKLIGDYIALKTKVENTNVCR